MAALRDATTEHGALLLRRGCDRVPRFARWRASALRHYAGFDFARKNSLWRAARGAYAARADILELLDFEVADEKVPEDRSQGTYNANPMSAIAGIAALKEIQTGGVCKKASENGAKIRKRVNLVFAEDIPWAAYGDRSSWYVYTNPEGADIDPLTFDGYAGTFAQMSNSGGHPAAAKLRLDAGQRRRHYGPGGTLAALVQTKISRKRPKPCVNRFA